MKNMNVLSAVVAVLGIAILVFGVLLGRLSFAPQMIVVFVGIVLLGAGFEAYRQWD